MADHTSKLLLGTLLCSPDLIESTDELDASLFPRGRERDLFDFISKEWNESRPERIDIVKASNHLDGDNTASWVSGLMEFVATFPLNTEDFRKQVGELVKKKLTKEIFKKLRSQENLPDLDLSEIKPLLTRYETAGDKEKRLAADVRALITSDEFKGEFYLNQIYSVLGVVSDNGKAGVRQVLARMVKEGVIDHAGKEYGRYRKVGKLAEPIDLMATVATPIELYLPLGLDELVYIYPKSVIVVAGEGQQGKTALALDFVKKNMKSHDVRYYFTEGGPEELRSRLEKHADLAIPDWTMAAFEHSGHIADVIAPDAFNVYDYLYVPDPFYIVNDIFQEVHKKLNKGIAFINLQKNRNKELGDGGDFSLRIPRLYITLAPDKNVISPGPDLQYVTARIIKAKGWKKHVNPDGRVMPFSISEGWKITPRCAGWEYPESIQEVKRKKIF